jgi:hypothetical protein
VDVFDGLWVEEGSVMAAEGREGEVGVGEDARGCVFAFFAFFFFFFFFFLLERRGRRGG